MTALLHSVIHDPTIILFPLEYVIKSACLMLLALVILPLIRSCTPALRFHILRASFIAVGLLAILWPILPSWQVSPSGVIDIGSLTTVSMPAVTDITEETTASMPGWIVWPLFVWAIGVVILGARFIIGLAVARRLIKSGRTIADADFLKTAERIAGDLGVHALIRYVLSDTVGIPMVVGIFHPTILIPPDLPHDKSACDMVLRHETAHVKRNDVFWVTLASVISILLWFNPLIWILKRKMIIESEYACDDYVLITGGQAQFYAEHLLHSAHRVSRLPRIVAASSTFNTELEGRIMSILENRKRAVSVRSIVSIGIIVAVSLLIMPLAGISMISTGVAPSGDKAITTKSESADKDEQAKQDEQAKKDQQAKTEAKTKKDEQAKKDMQAKEDMKAKKEQQAKEDYKNIEKMPEMTFEQEPLYPKELQDKGIEGAVMVKAYVTKDGMVKKAEVGKSSGYEKLDQLALDAAYKNKFKPAYDKEGNPVGMWISYKVTFTKQ